MDYPVAVNKFFPLKLEFVDINHRLLFDLKCLIQPLKMNHSAKGFEGKKFWFLRFSKCQKFESETITFYTTHRK